MSRFIIRKMRGVEVYRIFNSAGLVVAEYQTRSAALAGIATEQRRADARLIASGEVSMEQRGADVATMMRERRSEFVKSRTHTGRISKWSVLYFRGTTLQLAGWYATEREAKLAALASGEINFVIGRNYKVSEARLSRNMPSVLSILR